MTEASDITLGELGRLVVGIRDEQREFRADVATKFEALDSTYLRTEVHRLTMERLNERISTLEGTLQWVTRAVAMTIIAAVGGGVVEALRLAGS